MICAYCQREVPQDGIFCPYCGKSIKGPKAATVKNKDLILILPFELFEKEFNELKKMDAKGAYAWYKGRHEPFEVFFIEVEYVYYPHNYYGNPIPNTPPEDRTGTYSKTGIINMMGKYPKEYRIKSIRPVKKYLRSSCINYDKGAGNYFFFYEKDAENAIAEVEQKLKEMKTEADDGKD